VCVGGVTTVVSLELGRREKEGGREREREREGARVCWGMMMVVSLELQRCVCEREREREGKGVGWGMMMVVSE